MPAINLSTTERFVGTQRYRPTPTSAFSVSLHTAGSTLEEIRTSVKVDGWKEKIAKHQNATSSRECKRKRLTVYSPLSCVVRWTNNAAGYNNALNYVDGSWLAATVYTAPPYPASLTAVPGVNNKFYSLCYAALEKFEGATWVAELKETLEFLRHPFTLIREVLDSQITSCRAARKKLKTSKGALRFTAGVWIEKQFALVPLLSDLESILQRLSSVSKETFAKPIKAWGNDNDTFASTGSGTFVFGVNSAAELAWTTVGITKKRTKIVGAVVIPPLAVDRAYGFDPVSWVLAGWEIVPWSFLVDYVLPVGEFIEACSVRTASIAWSSTTTKWESHTNIWGIPKARNIGGVTNCTVELKRPLGALAEAKWLKRTVGVEGVRLPSLHFTTSVKALINSIALLILSPSNRRGGRL